MLTGCLDQWDGWEQSCSHVSAPVSACSHLPEAVASRTTKPRCLRGFVSCAEEDSNLHPVIPDQALNLARLPIPPSAQAGAEYSPGPRAVESVHGARYCHEQVFDAIQETGKRMDIGKDLTKRQQEIFDFIKKYSAKYGYP